MSQHSAVRFLIVGGLTFTVDETALFVLHGVIGLWLGLATVLAFAFAFGVNFGLNRVWVFASGRSGGTPSSSSEPVLGRQLGRYLLLVAVNLLATFLFVPGLTALGVYYLVSKAVVAGVLAIMNYIVSRVWIFI